MCFTIEMLFKLIAMGFVFHRNAYLRSAWCAATLPRASWVRGLGRFTKWEAVCGRVRACACVRACVRVFVRVCARTRSRVVCIVPDG